MDNLLTLEVIRYDIEAPSDKIPSITALGEELADCIIRILDTSYDLRLDIGQCVAKKMLYNWKRPHKHGGKKF